MATAITTRKGIFTYRDFCALVHDGQKGDLIDGVIYMASPESVEANKLFLWLAFLMDKYAETYNLGTILGSRVACRLDDANSPEPDIIFIAKSHTHRVQSGGIEGIPDLAIEIVCAESAERDYHKKRKQYEKFGIPEYWIIDQEFQKVTLLHLEKTKYREGRLRKSYLRSKVMPGFKLNPDWLWDDPLPDKQDIFNLIVIDE